MKSDDTFHADETLPLVSLTARERAVLRLLATGMAYKQIADELSVSAHTVNNHLRNIRGKFGVHSSIEAICKAQLWHASDPHGHIENGQPTSESTVTRTNHTMPVPQ